VIVTVCAVFQFPDVNVSEAGDTVPSEIGRESSRIGTFAVG